MEFVQVILYFAEKVDKLEQRSTEYVKEALEMGAKQFPLDRLKVNARIRIFRTKNFILEISGIEI